MRKLSQEQIAQACERYQQGESSESIARDLDVSSVAIRGLLKRRNIDRRSQSEAQLRQYACNSNYFSLIDTEAKAYWLGFLSADGFIREDGALVLHLASIDEEHIRSFLAALHSSHLIKRSLLKGNSYSKVYIQSYQLCNDLAKWGVTHKKTFTLQWPTLSDELLRHFLRGYTDGDGGFYFSKTKYPTPNLSFAITSNELFIQSCQNFLCRSVGVGKTKPFRRHPESPIDTLVYCGTLQVTRIAKFLYEGATIYLGRKREKIEGFLES